MHVRVVEPRQHDPAAQVDDLRRGERRLVHADTARDQVARDGERSLGRDLGIEGPDQSALKDHSRKSRVAGPEVLQGGGLLT